jgi:RNA polymerase sigma-70 factor (subfamily 1)
METMGSDTRSAADLLRLILGARDGDRAAFGKVMARYRGRLERLVRAQAGAVLGQRMEVEDLVGETVLQALLAIQGFRGSTIETFECWLFTIARHVVQGLGKKASGKPLEVPLSSVHSWSGTGRQLRAALPARGPSPSSVAGRKEEWAHLESALRSLRPSHQKVLLLARVKELSMAEVGILMGITRQAASVLLWRAMGKLKEAMDPADGRRLPVRRDEAREKSGGA